MVVCAQRSPSMARVRVLAICSVCALCTASARRMDVSKHKGGGQPTPSASQTQKPSDEETPPPPSSVFRAILASSSSRSSSTTGASGSVNNFDDFIQTVEATPYEPSDYWVFIKNVGVVPLMSASRIPAHTELAMCARRKHGTKEDISQQVESIINQDLADCGSKCQFLSPKAARALSLLLPRCLLLYYASNDGVVAAYGKGPDDQTAYGFRWQNGVSLTWVGVVKDFRIANFMTKMKDCGNWEAKWYNLVTNNCNIFSRAALKGMGFVKDFGLLSRAEVPMVREPGYFDTKTGHCQGMFCTAFGPDVVSGCGPCTEFEAPRKNSSGAALGT